MFTFCRMEEVEQNERSASPVASLPPPSRSPSPSPSPPPAPPTLKELQMQMKPCKVVLQNCIKNESFDVDDVDASSTTIASETREKGQKKEGGGAANGADDGYEDSSETAQLPVRGLGPKIVATE